MSTTTTPESDDYKRGFRDGVEYMERFDDEMKIIDVILGNLTREDLSPRQLKMMDSMPNKPL